MSRDPGQDPGRDPDVHPSDEQLWDSTDADVLAHVDGCDACRRRRRALDEQQRGVTARLAEVAGPVPVPTEVRQRITRVLAEESAHRVVVPLHRRSRPLLVAAAAAAVVVGVGLVVPQLRGGTQTVDDQAVVAAEDSTGGAGGDTAGSGADRAAPEAGADLAETPGPAPAPTLPADLLAAAQQLTGGDTACGTSLAAELGATVVGSQEPAAADRGGVLVVVQDAGGRSGWWLPTCQASVADAFGASALP